MFVLMLFHGITVLMLFHGIVVLMLFHGIISLIQHSPPAGVSLHVGDPMQGGRQPRVLGARVPVEQGFPSWLVVLCPWR